MEHLDILEIKVTKENKVPVVQLDPEDYKDNEERKVLVDQSDSQVFLVETV